MDTLTVGYLAGLFDGEGHIGITRTRRKHRGGRFGYQALAAIGMTWQPLIFWLETFGSKTTTRKRRKPNHKQAWLATWRGEALRTILPVVLPHLRIKQRQAELVLEYLAFAGRFNHKDAAAVAAYMGRCEAIYQELKRLNKRGSV